jgi:hypothetical protein
MIWMCNRISLGGPQVHYGIGQLLEHTRAIARPFDVNDIHETNDDTHSMTG